MTIKKEILDELLKDYSNPEDLLGESGIIKQLTKALLERALDGEMTHHLGYQKHAQSGRNSGNSRNGKNRKSIISNDGKFHLQVPRDRNATFDPKIIKKRQKRFDGFDDKIISMYARGMTVREIQGHLEEIYGIEVSPDLISTVTASVIEELRSWQNRPLESVYPIVYLDALRVKIRDNGHIYNKAVYVALGITTEGMKEVLGLWIAKNEGAKFWLQVVSELQNRGLKDIFIACVDGLKGFPDAVESIFPQAQVQLCIVHMIRHSVKYVSYKDLKQVCADLKLIYRSSNAEQAEQELQSFAKKWDNEYSMISESWRRNWQGIIPFLAYPEHIRKVIYTTNAIESLHHSLRKIIKTRGSFPNDESALKLLYLGLKNISKRWTMPIRVWKQAVNQFAILFADRFPFEEL